MQAFRRVLSLEPAFCVVGGMTKILRSNTAIDGSDTAHPIEKQGLKLAIRREERGGLGSKAWCASFFSADAANKHRSCFTIPKP